MKYFYLLFIVFIVGGGNFAIAQTPGINKSVLLSAEVQPNPPRITLNWEPFSSPATAISILKKEKDATGWQTTVASNLSGSTTSWTDTNVAVGVVYEYKVQKSGTNPAEGYITSGIEIPEVFYRGTILLVYDTIATQSLAFEIDRWESDVYGDGWDVVRIPVNPLDLVTNVKSRIVAEYNKNPNNVKAVFLLGRVPVPYSGNFAPDGHGPDHVGAWPSDGYYADMDGVWTDVAINNTGASQARNHNIPGDGKLDQNAFPSLLELQIGRVDMRNLPAFSLGETPLLKRYFDKNHAYRNKYFGTLNRAVIADHFAGYAEGFSASGWRSFSSLCGATNIVTTDYFSTLTAGSYRWSFGCGGGLYNSASGIGSTADFAADSLRGIFTMLFGSYFGDWDSPSDNFLRASIASGTTLISCWAGRPHWYFHHMGMGETVGFSALRSMNNTSLYEANFYGRGVHMALMGDPTLRADILAPAENLVATYMNGFTNLAWSPSTDAPLGYNIYRKSPDQQRFEQINASIITGTQYIDSCLIDSGVVTYMVRAIQLEETNSGSYFNLSTGIVDTIYSPLSARVKASFVFTQNQNEISFNNTSDHAQSFHWDFGDGHSSTDKDPVHQYLSGAGSYTVTLAAIADCAMDTIRQDIFIDWPEGISDAAQTFVHIFPNPTDEWVYIRWDRSVDQPIAYTVLDVTGRIVHQSHFTKNSAAINLGQVRPGLYLLQFEVDGARVVHRIVVQR